MGSMGSVFAKEAGRYFGHAIEHAPDTEAATILTALRTYSNHLAGEADKEEVRYHSLQLDHAKDSEDPWVAFLAWGVDSLLCAAEYDETEA